MSSADTLLKVDFENSGESREVSLVVLTRALTEFLEYFGEKKLVGDTLYAITGDGDGRTRLARLLAATGYPDDAAGFFTALLSQLGIADGSRKIDIGDVRLPPILLVAVLEEVLPGTRFVSIKTVDQFEKETNLSVPADERKDLQTVIDTYPVR